MMFKFVKLQRFLDPFAEDHGQYENHSDKDSDYERLDQVCLILIYILILNTMLNISYIF